MDNNYSNKYTCTLIMMTAFAFIEKMAFFLLNLITTDINILWLISPMSSFYPTLKINNIAWSEKKIQQNNDYKY